jgi:hypothetical protein
VRLKYQFGLCGRINTVKSFSERIDETAEPH